MSRDDEIHEREFPDESDMDDSDDPELVPCPYCRKMIYEDAELCHHCGQFIVDEDARARIPYWIIAMVLILILMAVVWRLW